MFTKKHLTLLTLIHHAARRLRHVKQLSPKLLRSKILKNSLTTKLLAYVNFVIFHEKLFLVKLSIS